MTVSYGPWEKERLDDFNSCEISGCYAAPEWRREVRDDGTDAAVNQRWVPLGQPWETQISDVVVDQFPMLSQQGAKPGTIEVRPRPAALQLSVDRFCDRHKAMIAGIELTDGVIRLDSPGVDE